MGLGICGIGRWLLRLWPVGTLLDMLCRVFIVCLDLGSEANDKHRTEALVLGVCSCYGLGSAGRDVCFTW